MSAFTPPRDSVDYQVDQVRNTAQRVQTERDIFKNALLDILRGRYFFGDRPREIAHAAIEKAERL